MISRRSCVQIMHSGAWFQVGYAATLV